MKVNKFCFHVTFFIKLFIYIILPLQVVKADNYIVALIDNDPITSIDILEKSKLLHFNNKKNNNYNNLNIYFKKSLNLLIEEKLIINEAKKFNKDILLLTKANASNLVLKNFSGSKEKFKRFLNKYKLSEEIFLMNLQIKMIKKFLIDNQFSNELELYTKQIDEEAEKIIENEKLDQVNFEEIRIYKDKNTKNINKILKLIQLDLKKGFNFKYIEKIYSKKLKISSKTIGWKNINEMPVGLFKNIFNMQEGQIIKIDKKNHVKLIKLLAKRISGEKSKREDKFEVLKIIYDTNVLTHEKLNKKITQLEIIKNCNNFKKNIDMLNSVKSEKLIIRLADINEFLINQLNSIKLFKITKPIIQKNYEMTFLKCKKINTNTINLKKEKLKRLILSKKIEILSSKLIRRLRSEAIIEIKNN